MNTIVINLIGGPCSGKSTQAAKLFSALKERGIRAELLTEKIKPYIYEKNNSAINCQIKLFAEELYELQNLNGKCDIIVHDGSLINNVVYDLSNNHLFHSLVIQEFNKFNNITFFLNREDIPFESFGRIHDRDESLDLDEKIKNAHRFAGINFNEVSSKNAVEEIISFALSLSEGS